MASIDEDIENSTNNIENNDEYLLDETNASETQILDATIIDSSSNLLNTDSHIDLASNYIESTSETFIDDAIENVESVPDTFVTKEIAPDKREIEPEMKKLLEQYLEENAICDYSMELSPGSNVGDNMVGIITKVQINGKKNNNDISMSFIVKSAPKLETFRKMIPIELIFEREVYIYDTVFRLYRQLEKEHQILKRFDSYPEYYFCYLEPFKENLVMKDMKSIGYVMKNKKEPLDLEHVKLVMKAFGKMHALSYALKHHLPDTFDVISNKLVDIFSYAAELEQFRQSFQHITDNGMKVLHPVKDALLIKKFQKYADKPCDIFIEACTAHNKYSVIGQGDSWITNMLFKYGNSSFPLQPTQVCLLDFQLARYASPVCDLSYFIFTCTDKTFRDLYYDNMIKLYYYTLCGHLNDLGCNPEVYLPFEALEAELRRYSIVGVHMSLMALMAMTREADEMPNMQLDTNEEDMMEKMLKTSKNQEMYNNRIRDIIVDYVQKGYLDFLQ